ncbi:MAG TPA: xanthine dehydrogenase family protein subunit M [Kofleriaceae bacterium]|nr:xanthine dehydrogenase family protein subunit M [Kofleriaceae bacterium]
MNELTYRRPRDTADALEALAHGQGKPLAGGTNLVDLMRQNVEHPGALVDVSRLARTIEGLPDGGLRLGAGAKNSAVAADRRVRERFPVLAEAILHGASGQIRNMASIAGNVMQRTRCPYFYDGAARCNKRAPGTGCDAIHGVNRMHAVLGTSASCIAAHPSDLCVALALLDATVQISGPRGDRAVAINDFYRLPGDSPHIETALAIDELITAVDLPAAPIAQRSLYRKVRDRSSFAFALVSVAAALELDGTTIRDVRIALGGVATRPWRARLAEDALRGQPVSEAVFRRAAELELAPAVGHGHNDFKIELARRVITGALDELAGASR